MPSYIIDIWKDGELVQSIAGKWTDDEARRLTVYYLGYYHAERAQLLRERLRTGDALGSHRRNLCARRPGRRDHDLVVIRSRACRRSLIPACRRAFLGALPLGARQAASTQKDRRGFARRVRRPRCFLGPCEAA